MPVLSSVQVPSPRDSATAVGVALPTSFNPIWIISHGYSQRLVSYIIIEAVKETVNVGS